MVTSRRLDRVTGGAQPAKVVPCISATIAQLDTMIDVDAGMVAARGGTEGLLGEHLTPERKPVVGLVVGITAPWARMLATVGAPLSEQATPRILAAPHQKRLRATKPRAKPPQRSSTAVQIASVRDVVIISSGSIIIRSGRRGT